MTDPKVKKKGASDAIKSIMPIVVPYAAKMLINLVPAGSKVEDFFVKYKSYWEKVAPAISTLVLQLTNMPDVADDIVAELSAEVARAIKEKYSDGENLKDLNPEKSAAHFSVATVMMTMEKSKLVKFNGLLLTLPEGQRKDILSKAFGSKEDTKKAVELLSSLNKTQFQQWADLIAPVKTPKGATKFEQAIEKGLDEFSQDTKSFFKKDSYFTRLAKQKKLM